jgi:hypothetical protein
MPPDNVNDIIYELFMLLSYLSIIQKSQIITLRELRIDLTMLKLIGAANYLIGGNIFKANRESRRMGQTIKTKHKISDTKKGYVIAIYKQGPTIRIGMTLSAVAKEIENIFKERRRGKGIPENQKIPINIDPPGVEQIKRYLEAEVDGDFTPRNKTDYERRIKIK